MSSSKLICAARQLAVRSLVRPSAGILVATRFESTRFYSSVCSTVHDNDPETLEREKQRNLSGKQHKTSAPHKHAPGWNEYLASSSEAAVKADRSEGGLADLQKSTTEHIRARHHADEDDKAQGDTQAGPEFEREKVNGPLGAAKGNVADRGERSRGVEGGKP